MEAAAYARQSAGNVVRINDICLRLKILIECDLNSLQKDNWSDPNRTLPNHCVGSRDAPKLKKVHEETSPA